MNKSFYFSCLITGTFTELTWSEEIHLILLNIADLCVEKYTLYSFLRQQNFQFQVSFHNKNNQIVKSMESQILVNFYTISWLFAMQNMSNFVK